MSGSQWSPNGDLNPAKNWDYVDGPVGLVYETAVPLQPADGQVHPVARHERQVDARRLTYVMTIRAGVKFSDGKTMTPKDVKYSFDLLKIATHPQHPLWATPGC